ncbi:NBR1-Ig-like domain-containing protein [Pseudoduganella armeniaca]|uniref:Uncharacterized protein n=1 Tax=Pseudoduganella armeniaca TaxID=2072590 RepID=A0A2R4C6L3_9BURK|nr:NBR1-Ig-like domain-containing protein [Pseudoduganella armeniaca]AVR95244.1 hypothetical protein C9I28_05535 [Pseudoduganella armeniaca]
MVGNVLVALALVYRDVRKAFGYGCWLLLVMLSLQTSEASAQAVFRSVAVSATSGTADSSGKFSVTFSGYVKASVSNDAVENISIVEGATYLDVITITPMINDKTGMPINTERAITNKVLLSPGVHTLRVLATTVSGGEAASQNFVVTVASNTPVYSAKLLSENAPTTMNAGQQYSIAMTVQNTGNTTWTTTLPDAYKLGSQQPNDNWTWGLQRVLMSAPVAPGGSTTFNFTVTAPTTPGTYSFGWGMLQENQRWFADLINKSVSVVTPPPVRGGEVTPVSVPSTMYAGQSYTVSFNLKNTGNTTWTPDGVHPYFLGSQNPENNTIWNSGRVALASQLAPGASRTISFTVTAPQTPGQYDMRWRMVHEQEAWFGNTTSSLITVTEALPTVTLSSPSNGATYTASGGTATVSLSGSAAGTAGATISRLEFFDGATSLGYVASTSISLSKALAVGSHTIELRATDNRGKVKSAYATITVAGPAPTAALSAPANNAAYVIASGSTVNVQVAGSVSSSGTISKLEVLDGTTPIHTTSGSSVNVALALAAGKHALRLRATDSTGQVGTSAVSNVSVYATTAGKAAEFVSQSMPTSLRAGQPVTFSVSMINTGTTTWSEGEKYRLGSQNPQDNRTWIQRVYLSNAVAPGQVGVFTATVTAPQAPGTYNFQWRMLHEYVTWFGAMTDNATVTVASGAGPTATLTGTPTNVRVSGANTAAVTLTGNGSRSGGTVSKLELFQANVTAFYPATPIKTLTGSSSSLALSASLNLPAGVHFFKLRSTDSAGLQTESVPVVVNITNSALLGTIGGVRTNAAGTAELYGWTCQPGNAAALNYKVLLDAPSLDAGGVELTTGVANVATELDNASVQSQCATPGNAHHFVVNLSTYLTQYAGRRLYVWAETADKATMVSLPCAENNCTMPGTTRVGITTPTANATFVYPAPAFLKMKLTNYSGTFDEVGFFVNGQWIAAQPDGAAGEYSVQKTGLAASTTPYTVYAVARQGRTAIQSAVVPFYVSNAVSTTITLNAANAMTTGIAQALAATTTGQVQGVQFILNGSVIATAASNGSTWSAAWTPSTAGTYSLVARAIDGTGVKLAESAPLSVVVTQGSGSSASPLPVAIAAPHLNNPDADTLPGSLGVGASGGATYEIQIAVPPGSGGLTPNLSLNYSGDAPNSAFGLGWSLSGTSTIQRCPRTIAQDGFNGRVSFASTDRLCLDGQRLVLVNLALSDANYWADGAEYRTEIDTYARIRAMRDAAGNRYFSLEAKDGRISLYGSGTGYVRPIIGAVNSGALARQPAVKSGALAWAVDKISDRSGNFISFGYSQDETSGEHLLRTVRYGGNGQHAHAAVEFTYGPRPDAWKRFLDEARTDLRSLVTNIRTYTGADLDGGVNNATLVRNYVLRYQTSATSGRSLLESVQPCAMVGAREVCRESTKFSWGQPDPTKTAGFVSRGIWSGAPVLTTWKTLPSGDAGKNHAEYFSFADFERDGFADVLEKRVAPASGAKPDTELSPLPIGTSRTQYRYFHNTGTGFAEYSYGLNTGEAFVVLDTADFNGDGALDLLVSTSAGPKVCLSPFGSATTLASPIQFNCDNNLKAVGKNSLAEMPYLLDILGDGRTAAYGPIGSDGAATLCMQQQCIQDINPPATLLSTRYGNDGTPDATLRNFVNITQSVDFSGSGKSYDVRWTRPHYTEYIQDADGSPIYVNRWDNLRPQVAISSATYPGLEEVGNIDGYAYAPYTMSGKNARIPYLFDAPVQMAGLAADMNGSGYNSLVFGFKELGWDANYVMYHKRAEFTACVSTGRALDCGVRQKYSGANYRSIHAVGNFVGDGAPSILAQTWNYPAGGVPRLSGNLEMCRLMGDDTTNGTGTADSNIVCVPWGGITMPNASASAAADQVYFLDLLGTGRTQLVYYHSGKPDANSHWVEDGRWEVFEPVDVARSGEALDRIVRVTNGLGLVSSVEYTDGVAQRVVTLSGTSKLSYPQYAINIPAKIVRRLRVGNGVSPDRTTAYQYLDGATDVVGRGPIGFGQVITTDEDKGTITTTSVSQQWPFFGMTISTTAVSNGVTLISATSALRDQLNTAANGAVTHFPYVEQTSIVRKDLDGSALGTVVTENKYTDGWGNINRETVTSTEPKYGKFVSDVAAQYRNDSGNWLLGLPTSIVTTRTDPVSGSLTRTIGRSYYPSTGLLYTETTEPGNRTHEIVTTHERNAFGLDAKTTQSWTDPATGTAKVRTQSVTYDANGRFMSTSTNTLGQVETYGYDAATGMRTSLLDANKLSTVWTVNAFGQVATELQPDGRELRHYTKSCDSTCPVGAVAARITELYHGGIRMATPQVWYSDAAGHELAKLSYGLDERPIWSERSYDSSGRVAAEYQPRFAGAARALSMRKEYDVLDRVTREYVLDEAGTEQASKIEYRGTAIIRTNAKLQQRVEIRDAIGQLRQVTDAKSGMVRFDYDPFGNVSSSVDPNGNQISIQYDLWGRKVALRDPDLGFRQYWVDPLGRNWKTVSPVQRAAVPQQATTFEYDLLGRMTRRLEPDLDSHWEYDTAVNGIGKLARAYTGSCGLNDYCRVHRYDSKGRPAGQSIQLSDATYQAQTDYDAWGRVITKTYRRGTDTAKVFESRYNERGRLVRIEHSGVRLWQATAQDAAMRYTEELLGNGLTQLHNYHPYTQRLSGATLKNAAGQLRLQDGYEYDRLGNVESRSQYWDQSGFTERLGYDELNRLISSQVQGRAELAFKYDAGGNLTFKSDVSSSNYVYPTQGIGAKWPHAVASIAGVGSYGYDEDGNMTSGPGRTSSWYTFDMPKRVTKGSSSATFVYGPEHQRVRQDRGDGSQVVYAGDQEVAISAGGQATVKTYWPMGIGLDIDKPGDATELNWVHRDRLDSVTAISSDAGMLKEKLAYDAWGKRRLPDGSATPDTLDGQVDNRGFTDHEMLDQLDLIHMNGRVYDPMLARFMSADPLLQDPGNGQNFSRYSYVYNNPTNLTDPSGYETTVIVPGCSSCLDIKVDPREVLNDLKKAFVEAIPRIIITARKVEYVAPRALGTISLALMAGNWMQDDPCLAGEMCARDPLTGKLTRQAYLQKQAAILAAENKGDKGANDSLSDNADRGKGANTASGGAMPPEDEDEDQNKDRKKPNDKLEKGDKVDLDRFGKRVKVEGETRFEDPKSGYQISKDRAGGNSHGGSAWKLLDRAGERVGTLSSDGTFLRK